MRRVLALPIAVALTLALAAGAASADVHGVSQAGCAAEGAPSGADQSGEAPGRPTAPIPVTASGGKHEGKAGDGDRACDVKPTE
jgi:hypothetical protein